MEQSPATIGPEGHPRLESIEEKKIKSEPIPGISPATAIETADPTHVPNSKSPSSNAPLPSTEQPPPATAAAAAMAPGKKKGMAKKAPKRAKGRTTKSPKKKRSTPTSSMPDEEASDDEESDHGPYCICRGPDDHRWMICCENCEDWFHGECINIEKDVGEGLIEKFICPNCTNANLFTLWKKTCALHGCRKASRLSQAEQSVFCSDEHAHTWWERTVAKLPKTKGKGGLGDQLSQGEFMALLDSGLSGLDEEGRWRLAKSPFANEETDERPNGDDPGMLASFTENSQDAKLMVLDNGEDKLSHILSEEEKAFLESAANARFHLAEETLLCGKMLNLIEFAQERHRAAVASGRFSGEDICGYDQRLDTVCARDSFAAFVKSPDGEAVFKAGKLSDPLGEDDQARGMCERKRCKVHLGWQKMLVLGIKHQIREMAAEAEEVAEKERVMREAASERYRRKKAENNWVQVLDG